ncbi:MAG: RRXRR domain-containing protein [Stigonema ocellatum SAG 48.90 = DSM 106950]|nr:RRXRR domain-containing protein [Stigonema ocellatum SAG 48.90 = DSM 106950]
MEPKQKIVKEINKVFHVASYSQTIQELSIKFASDGDEEALDNKIEEVFERFDIDVAREFCDQLVELEKQSNSIYEVVWAGEIEHRGLAIKGKLKTRRELRRFRRSRKTRYRQPPNTNWFRKGKHQPCPKQRRDGWLAPSLLSRVHNIETWVKRLQKYAPITAISQELVRFDTQIMENPEITGKEYQQGTLKGYETREYLLEKWGRKCAYCDLENVPFQVEHIHPRAKGGSNRISNLTLSCEKCNIKKGTRDIQEFLKKDPTRLKKIQSLAKQGLADAAAVNSTKFKCAEVLKSTGLPVETGTSGLTKFNRSTRNLDKTHWIDAACVGTSTPEKLNIKGINPLLIKATGHGSRQSCRTDKFGFPKSYVPREKVHFGFQTGDIVKAVVEKGKKIGTHIGRVAIRVSGSFNISTIKGLIEGGSHKCCKNIHHCDGYGYHNLVTKLLSDD